MSTINYADRHCSFDHQWTILRGFQLKEGFNSLKISADAIISRPSETVGTPPITSMATKYAGIFTLREKCRIQYRYHYRIVFKQVATPLHSVDSLRKVFSSSRDAMFSKYSTAYGMLDADLLNNSDLVSG